MGALNRDYRMARRERPYRPPLLSPGFRQCRVFSSVDSWLGTSESASRTRPRCPCRSSDSSDGPCNNQPVRGDLPGCEFDRNPVCDCLWIILGASFSILSVSLSKSSTGASSGIHGLHFKLIPIFSPTISSRQKYREGIGE